MRSKLDIYVFIDALEFTNTNQVKTASYENFKTTLVHIFKEMYIEWNKIYYVWYASHITTDIHLNKQFCSL